MNALVLSHLRYSLNLLNSITWNVVQTAQLVKEIFIQLMANRLIARSQDSSPCFAGTPVHSQLSFIYLKIQELKN